MRIIAFTARMLTCLLLFAACGEQSVGDTSGVSSAPLGDETGNPTYSGVSRTESQNTVPATPDSSFDGSAGSGSGNPSGAPDGSRPANSSVSGPRASSGGVRPGASSNTVSRGDDGPGKPVKPVPGKATPVPVIVQTEFDTEDVVIADVVATDPRYGADPTGVKDSTAAIVKALEDCTLFGGGTVWLPAGKYRVSASITIPAFVTLRGDYGDPDAGKGYGTVILADVPESDSDTTGLFLLGGSGGVMGLTVYYPNQSLDKVKKYPFAFYVSGGGFGGYMLQSVVNCTVINGYRGIGACVASGQVHEMLTVENFKGTFLRVGAEVYNQADVGTWKNVRIDPKYWAEARDGLQKADASKLRTYLQANADGLILGDLEWTQFANLTVDGYKTGIKIVKGKRIEFAGSLFDVTVKNCKVGIEVQYIDTRWGMVLAKSNISGSDYSIVNKTGGVVKMTDVTLSGKTSGSGLIKDETSLSDVTIDYHRKPAKPKARLFTVSAVPGDVIDGPLQRALAEAGKEGGGVVYIPGGYYYLRSAVTVPAGVELRGASSSAQREQSGYSAGTVLLVTHGVGTSNPETAQAAVTLAGQNAGVRGLRFFYPDNRPENWKTYPYTVRGKAAGVYVVNCAIGAAGHGVDFRECDNHFVKKLVGFAYENMMTLGGNGGHAEGCLQNGTAIYRTGLNLNWESNEGSIFEKLFNPISRVRTNYIRLNGAKNQTVYNCFAYGVRTLVLSENADSKLVNQGADNLGSGTPMLKVTGGRVTGVNLMRYNGKSYEISGASALLCNRLTINDKNEKTVKIN